jgi:hypothetical protein
MSPGLITLQSALSLVYLSARHDFRFGLSIIGLLGLL